MAEKIKAFKLEDDGRKSAHVELRHRLYSVGRSQNDVCLTLHSDYLEAWAYLTADELDDIAEKHPE